MCVEMEIGGGGRGVCRWRVCVCVEMGMEMGGGHLPGG